MKKLLHIKELFNTAAGLMVLGILTVWTVPGLADETAKPSVLIFDVNADETVSPANVAIATSAIRDYFRQTGKVEAVVFDKKSPLVARAIMEHKITPDKVVNYDDRDSRIEVARALGIDYVCGARMSVEQLKVRMSMWLINAAKPKQKWELNDYVAESGRMDDLGMRNAIHSVCSGMVNEIVQSAFQNVPADTAAVDDQEMIQSAPIKPIDRSGSAVDFGNAAVDSLRQGNTARAVDMYQRAINANPTDFNLRIKLAEVYHKRGMDQEANDELDRAIALGADKDIVETARSNIFANIPAGANTAAGSASSGNSAANVNNTASAAGQTNAQTNTQANVSQPNTSTANPAPAYTGVDSAGVIEGDKLWDAGDAVGAERAYLKAIADNPKDWRAFERLAILQAAQYRFDDSRKTLAQLNEVQPAPPEDVLRFRYRWLSQVLDYGVESLLDDMESSIQSFESHRITRELCYETVRSDKNQLQSLIAYAEELVYPPEMRQANADRVQACRLGMQAASGLLDYLETNQIKYKNNAQVFMQQAKVELMHAKSPSAASPEQ